MFGKKKTGGRLPICIILENEAFPYDRRVWMEACTLQQAGYAVSVICPKSDAFRCPRAVLEGIEVYRYWSWNSRSILGHLCEYAWSFLAQFFLALRVYARTRFRILQACNPPDNIFLIALFFKLFGVRFIFDHHDLSPELYAARFKRHPGRSFLHGLACIAERLTFLTANCSIATNESFREIAITRGKMHPERVVVVQTCAELRKPGPEVEHRPENHGAQLVVYVGSMEPQDGLDLLLKSADYIVNERGRHEIRFIAIGSGTELPRLRAMASRRNFNGNFLFTGRMNHDKVQEYLAASDVCVAPDPFNSLNDRSSMVKIFEYMAHGKPTVLYLLKEGHRTLGDAALYARPNDPEHFGEQILKLVDSEPLRQKLGESARKRVETDLNWGVQSKKLLEAYKLVLEPRPKRVRVAVRVRRTGNPSKFRTA
jgi:glycosyltransferase involved in cell wall biosynthesis